MLSAPPLSRTPPHFWKSLESAMLRTHQHAVNLWKIPWWRSFLSCESMKYFMVENSTAVIWIYKKMPCWRAHLLPIWYMQDGRELKKTAKENRRKEWWETEHEKTPVGGVWQVLTVKRMGGTRNTASSKIDDYQNLSLSGGIMWVRHGYSQHSLRDLK